MRNKIYWFVILFQISLFCVGRATQTNDLGIRHHRGFQEIPQPRGLHMSCARGVGARWPNGQWNPPPVNGDPSGALTGSVGSSCASLDMAFTAL